MCRTCLAQVKLCRGKGNGASGPHQVVSLKDMYLIPFKGQWWNIDIGETPAAYG